MDALTDNIQIIEQQGKPAFAVIPWTDYQHLVAKKTNWWGDDIPHEVVKAIAVDGISSIKAWRGFLKLTQQQVANKMGVAQSALARIENNATPPKASTISKIAQAMGISSDQLEW